MSEFTDAYRDLLIKQYWDKPKARAEIELQAGTWEPVRDILRQFGDEFDLDNATGHRLDIIGKIVGISRIVPLVVPKVAFGFDGYVNARGFDDKFTILSDKAPFRDKFERPYTDLELSDNDYRFFIGAKIALNTGSGYMVSNGESSIQDVVQSLFGGLAYVIDKKDMTLVLYVSPIYDLTRLTAIIQLVLLPKPQGVRYAYVIQAAPGETFGFSDNAGALGFADKFDAGQVGGRFAEKVIL
jgi:hypothetical protein